MIKKEKRFMINDGKEHCKENFSDAYEEAKCGIKKVRQIWLLLFAVSFVLLIVAVIVLAVKIKTDDYVFAIYFFMTNICVFVLVLWFFICAFTSCRCNRYFLDGNEIIVYAGFKNHYLKVNGELCDEYVASTSFSGVYLTTTVNGDCCIEAKISTANRITVKANGKLISPTK